MEILIWIRRKCLLHLGLLAKHKINKLHQLNLKEFDNQSEVLRDKFSEVCTVANNIKHEHGYSEALTTYELLEFTKLIADWALFQPISDTPLPIMLIELQPETYDKTKPVPEIPDLSHLSLLDFL